MYCKAYQLSQLRQFAGWSENPQVPEAKQASPRIEENKILSDDDLVYVQENYVVTEDLFIDEGIIFNNVTPEWQDFCRGVLMFDPVPDNL